MIPGENAAGKSKLGNYQNKRWIIYLQITGTKTTLSGYDVRYHQKLHSGNKNCLRL